MEKEKELDIAAENIPEYISKFYPLVVVDKAQPERIAVMVPKFAEPEMLDRLLKNAIDSIQMTRADLKLKRINASRSTKHQA